MILRNKTGQVQAVESSNGKLYTVMPGEVTSDIQLSRHERERVKRFFAEIEAGKPEARQKKASVEKKAAEASESEAKTEADELSFDDKNSTKKSKKKGGRK